MTLHALTVEPRARRHLPPATRTSGTSPETPTPVDEQSATPSFAIALRLFRFECEGKRAHVPELKRIRLECALQQDMRGEALIAERDRERETKRNVTTIALGNSTIAFSARYMARARADAKKADLRGSRATALRRTAAAIAHLGET